MNIKTKNNLTVILKTIKTVVEFLLNWLEKQETENVETIKVEY